jgi:hypothetical protein
MTRIAGRGSSNTFNGAEGYNNNHGADATQNGLTIGGKGGDSTDVDGGGGGGGGYGSGAGGAGGGPSNGNAGNGGFIQVGNTRYGGTGGGGGISGNCGGGGGGGGSLIPSGGKEYVGFAYGVTNDTSTVINFPGPPVGITLSQIPNSGRGGGESKNGQNGAFLFV